MEKQCFLKLNSIGPCPKISISEDEFHQIDLANKTLADAFSFELKFEMVLENYREFELSAAGWSLSAVIESRYEYSDFALNLMQANRQVVNLLSMVRMYLDQTERLFSHLDNSPPFKTIAKEMRSKAYGSSDAYRFMEALRNHVQHRGAAVHGMGEAAIAGRGVKTWAETVSIWAEKEMLQQDKGFKASVLVEMPDQVDLRAFAKKYVSSISLLHVKLRDHLSEVVSNARELIGLTVDRYKAELNEEVVGLNAYSVGHDQVGLRVPVMLNWDDVRRKMAEKNRWPLRIDPDVSKKW